MRLKELIDELVDLEAELGYDPKVFIDKRFDYPVEVESVEATCVEDDVEKSVVIYW